MSLFSAMALVEPPCYLLFLLGRLLQLADVDLFHLKHRLHDPLRFRGVLILKQFDQYSRNHLPRQTIFIFQPAALDFLPALGKLLPEIVHLFLRGAVYDERYGFGKFELGAAVKSYELLSVELEFNGHCRSFWSSGGLCPRFVIAGNATNLRILENRRIEIHSLFGFVIEPQERGYLLHMLLLRC